MLHKLHVCLHSSEPWDNAHRPNPITDSLTGASGWFGRTALHVYEQAHGPEALRREVIPFASRERWVEFGSSHGPVKAHPLEAILDVSQPRGLLHLAFLTRDKVEELGHGRYVAANRAITATLARLLQAWPALPVVATSSGAAAALDGLPADLAGNPYATLKQEEEVLLERQGATRMAVVFRVYAASGRFMTRPQKFALGDLILQGLRGEPLRVKAPHAVWRSYGSVEQLMQLSWLLLQGGPDLAGGLGFRRLDACGPAPWSWRSWRQGWRPLWGPASLRARSAPLPAITTGAMARPTRPCCIAMAWRRGACRSRSPTPSAVCGRPPPLGAPARDVRLRPDRKPFGLRRDGCGLHALAKMVSETPFRLRKWRLSSDFCSLPPRAFFSSARAAQANPPGWGTCFRRRCASICLLLRCCGLTRPGRNGCGSASPRHRPPTPW